MINDSRRDFLWKAPLAAVSLLATGCGASRLSIPTNALSNSRENDIDISEDAIKIQKTGILGNYYFIINLNNEERILEGEEPSYALIPEAKSRISIRQVGEKGGKVIIDAPQGDLYLPYVCKTNGRNHELSTDFSNIKPVRFVTNFKMEDLRGMNKTQGKIGLEAITEENLPFSDETLSAIGSNQYLINRANDMFDGNALPIYFTKLPIGVEYNRAAGDNKIRIVGDSYVFAKGQTIDDYAVERGFTNPIEERRIEMKRVLEMREKREQKTLDKQEKRKVEARENQAIKIDTKN